MVSRPAEAGETWRGTYHPIEDRGQVSKNPADATAGLDWSSKKEHKADALAPEADEGRDNLRLAAVRSKYPMTSRFPNGGTRALQWVRICT